METKIRNEKAKQASMKQTSGELKRHFSHPFLESIELFLLTHEDRRVLLQGL